ncbi:MAG: hypothetical protein JNK02_12200 [Planctomycetes bacterium]|nr:hypothetical protein [Planctomycetota bacterium]
MFFRHDPFGQAPRELTMHRRRTSRATASIALARSEDLPRLALHSTSRVTARHRLGRLFSFEAWARVLRLARAESLGTLPRLPKDGPRAA